jgi:site-specific recombinase XerD
MQLQYDLLTKFVQSRRQGLSEHTLAYYKTCLKPFLRSYETTPDGINSFLANLNCGNAKLNYYRAITIFVRWLLRTGYIKDNPLAQVDRPKPAKRILPSITTERVQHLIDALDSIRDKAIISLLADSGMRLNELANIHASDIDWDSYTITIIGKGNKQRGAPFTQRTAKLLQLYLGGNHHNGSIWNLKPRGTQTVLQGLEFQTGIKCNAHSFRRGFACNLHRKGLSTLDIMHLGGWEDLSMVLRYTRSITFEDCLEHYKAVLT